MKSIYFKIIAIFDGEHLLLFLMINCCGLFVYCEDVYCSNGFNKMLKSQQLVRRDRWYFWAMRENQEDERCVTICMQKETGWEVQRKGHRFA